MKSLFILAIILLASCEKADKPQPVPAVKVVDTAKPKSSRYILISGEAPRPGCYDTGDGFQSCP